MSPGSFIKVRPAAALMWMKIHKGYNTVIFNSDFVENKSGKYGEPSLREAGKNDYLFIVDSSLSVTRRPVPAVQFTLPVI